MADLLFCAQNKYKVDIKFFKFDKLLLSVFFPDDMFGCLDKNE